MMDPKKKKSARQRLEEMENFAEEAANGNSDVLGSYTGVPLLDDDDVPIQDADDL